MTNLDGVSNDIFMNSCHKIDFIPIKTENFLAIARTSDFVLLKDRNNTNGSITLELEISIDDSFHVFRVSTSGTTIDLGNNDE